MDNKNIHLEKKKDTSGDRLCLWQTRQIRQIVLWEKEIFQILAKKTQHIFLKRHLSGFVLWQSDRWMY